MKAAENTVVSIHYTLKDDDGSVIDSSVDSEPLKFLFGSGMIIPGLENHLLGKKAGDAFKISVPPDEAYGEFREDMVQEVPKDQLGHIEDLEIGSMLQADAGDGQTLNLVVTEISLETVTLDANHSLAGKTLHFEGKVVEVREASQEELDHGHSH